MARETGGDSLPLALCAGVALSTGPPPIAHRREGAFEGHRLAGAGPELADDAAVSPACARCSTSLLASSFATAQSMPMPQLKVRSISRVGDAAGRAQPAEHRRHVPRRRGRVRRRGPSGSTRGMLSMRPPPVMWASALMPCRPCGAPQQRLHVDAGRLEQRLGQRLAARRTAPARPRRGPSASTIRRTSE